MQFADLPPKTIEKMRSLRSDRIVEKHEGPERWVAMLDYDDPEFLMLAEHLVLLPIGRDQHPNITLLRCIVGDGGQSLTLFLKDTTDCRDPESAWLCAGFLAVCEQLPGEAFFLAVVYHEWFIIGLIAPGARSGSPARSRTPAW